MKNLTWLVLMFSLLLFSCNKNNDIELGEKTIDKFYKLENKEDYKSIDNLISTSFYRSTPYYKFIELLKRKKQITGSYKPDSADL